MHQYNPQPGPGYDSELRETTPSRLRPEVSGLVSNFSHLEDAISHQYPRVVKQRHTPEQEADEVTYRPHKLMFARPVEQAVIQPEVTPPTQTNAELRELEAASRRELDRIHGNRSDYELTA